MINKIIINRNEHISFLADHRKCPVSRKFLTVGDSVVVCAKCQLVFLEGAWVNTMKGIHCNQKKTLPYIPFESIVELKPNSKQKKRSTIPHWIVIIILGSIIYTNVEAYFRYKNDAAKSYRLQQLNSKLNSQINDIRLDINEVDSLREQTINLGNSIKLLYEMNVALETKFVDANRENGVGKMMNKLTKYQSSISNFYKSPIVIKDIDFQSTNNDRSTIYIGYDDLLYKSNIYYLRPRIHYVGYSQEKLKLGIRIINPDGSTKRNDQTSPIGFTYDYEFTSDKGNNTEDLLGWGNEEGRSYTYGQHEIEIWYNNNCIGYKMFNIQ